MEALTEQDVDILVEALDAWLDRGSGGRVMSALISGMFTKDDPEAKARWEADQAREQQEANDKKKRESVQVVFLKAKLFALVNAAEVADIAAADLR